MTRTIRHRMRDSYASRGYYGSFTGTIQTGGESCIDLIGYPRGDGYFSLERWTHSPVRISGQVNNTNVSGFVPDNHMLGGLVDWPGGVPDLDTAVTKALAHTNPNRRTVDMPVFVYELADLPKMVKSLGEGLLQHARQFRRPPKISDTITASAGRNLEVQFGWLPLISDIGKMLDFENIVAKRVKELQRLNSRQGLRRRFRVWEDELRYAGSDTTLQSSNFSAIADWEVINKGKCWATLRWTLDRLVVDNLPYHNSELSALARRATLDIDHELRQGVDAASVWEAIPFSWLIDYFSNVGDTLKSTRNEISVTPEKMCLMFSLDSVGRHRNVRCSAGLQGFPGVTKRVTKDRYVYTTPSPGLSANVGFLNPAQWSILGSLAVLSLTGGKPGVQL